MDRSKKPVARYKKLSAILVAIFMLCNFIFIFPAYATNASPQGAASTSSVASSGFCIPIPIVHPCKSPTPTPTPTCVNIPIIHPCKTPTITPTPTRGGGTPGPRPTATAAATPGKTPQLSLSGSFTLSATEIVGTNAHLSLADPLHPVLSFSSVTIEGMKLTHLSITLSASGTVTGSGAAIKTSILKEAGTALASFTDKADLLLLVAGVTVKKLTMKNVRLQVDRYIEMQSLNLNGLTVS